jgi:MOSC domain-containing protein YiiM
MQKIATQNELEAGLAWIQQSPKTVGRLELIVCRPSIDQRTTAVTGTLSIEDGLVGDSWRERGSNRMPDGTAHPDMQITIMNARVIQLLTQDHEQWPLAGDQLYVDLDLSQLEPGNQLKIGTAVLEITAMPHTGCKKFAERFGQEALRWVSTQEGRRMQLRGIYAKVVQPGVIHVGDEVQRI